LGSKDAQDKTEIILFSEFPIDLEEVNVLLRDAGFARIVKISKVVVLKEIPLTGTGKIHYRKLDELSQESS